MFLAHSYYSDNWNESSFNYYCHSIIANCNIDIVTLGLKWVIVSMRSKLNNFLFPNCFYVPYSRAETYNLTLTKPRSESKNVSRVRKIKEDALQSWTAQSIIYNARGYFPIVISANQLDLRENLMIWTIRTIIKQIYLICLDLLRFTQIA